MAVLDSEAGPGATAVLQGMLGTLAEVLGGLERRLVALETLPGAVEGIGRSLRELTDAINAAGEGEDEQEKAADAARTGAVLDALDAVAARSEAGLEAGLADLTSRQAALQTTLREGLERFEVAMRGQAAEARGEATSAADVVGRLEGRLQDIVEGVRAMAQHAHALAALPARVGALCEEVEALRRATPDAQTPLP